MITFPHIGILGRLGNQMFQYASLVGIADKYELDYTLMTKELQLLSMAKHDFERYPELTKTQMQFYYWASPHKQILESFVAEVIRVKDGDTIDVRWCERDFDFPVRFLDIGAPELKEIGGRESQEWLKNRIEGKEVYVRIDQNNRVGKWGRLLGTIELGGININLESVMMGHAIKLGEGIQWL